MKTILYRSFLSLFILFAANAFAQNCTITDKPDNAFTDVNNDGIDGDTAKAIFVAVTGNDMNSGKFNSPVATLEKAMQIASVSTIKDIYVSKGIYTLTNTLIIENGVSLYGLYDAQLLWKRDISNKVVVNGPQNVFLYKNNTISSTLDGFEINAADATTPGSNSQAITISNCSDHIIITNNIIKSGKGATGAAGTSGIKGNDGGNGGDGGSGMCDGNVPGAKGLMGISSCGLNGGEGGMGGVHANNGAKGQPGSSGAFGGSGGAYGDPGKSGIDGTDGTNGISGSRGFAQATAYTSDADGLIPSDGSAGTDGTDGTSGGGGGGGGGQYCTFCTDGTGNGGGGGGAAGCKGTAGQGGKGGGASIGVFIHNSKAYLGNNTISTKAGGNGGKGGDGGDGGTGGSPGQGGTNCVAEIGAGGNGGKGGDGGPGGGGSGGNGGASIGIAVETGSTVSGSLNTITLGAAGSGGIGGVTPDGGLSGATGNSGLALTIRGTLNPAAPQTFGELCIEDFKAGRPHSNLKPVLVKVFLSKPSPAKISVAYAFTQGTAIESTDFSFTNSTLEFAPNTTLAFIPFDILAKPSETASKDFTITISNPDGATISRATATVTIEPFNNQSVSTPDNMYSLNEWPNPFQGTGYIGFNAPSSSDIQIDMYDAMGKRVKTLFKDVSIGGYQAAEIHCEEFVPGIYYYAFMVNNKAVVYRKLVVTGNH